MQGNSIDVGGFTPQAETLLARTEKFRTTTLESGAFAWEFTERGPNVAALREAARLGMTGIEVDRTLGGLGFGFREKVRVAEILSRSSIGFAFSLINSSNVAARLATIGAERHRDAYLADLLAGRRFGATALTEPGVGSDFAAITTTASRTDGGWVLDGRKAWITNAAVADVFLCYAQTDPDGARDGIACFVVDGRRDGFESTDGYQLVSGSTVGVGGFTLDGYEAIEDDMIVEPGSGFRHALLGVNGARIYVAAMACSAVRAALGQAVEYGSTRESFGRPILDHQGLAWRLAAVANQLEAAEALTARAVDHYEASQATNDDRGDENDGLVRRSALVAAHAKKFATEMVEPALQACVQAMGAEGLRGEYVAGRLLSESRILSYVDGTTEMQTERIGRSLATSYGSDSGGSVSVATPAPTVAPAAESASAPDRSGLVDDDDVVASPDPTPAVVDRGRFHRDPVTADADVQAMPALADATRTMEFEPPSDIEAPGGFPGHLPHTSPEPVEHLEPSEHFESVAEPVESGDFSLSSQPPMPPPGSSLQPTEASVPSAESFGGEPPSSPPMPPPPPHPPASDEPDQFGSPPPPPPPTGPPLSTEPPESFEWSDSPLPSVPPMPPGPDGFADSMDSIADSPGGLTPPLPPPEFQQASDSDSDAAPPPLPGDEHRLDGEAADPPSAPPLPPESMRRSD